MRAPTNYSILLFIKQLTVFTLSSLSKYKLNFGTAEHSGHAKPLGSLHLISVGEEPEEEFSHLKGVIKNLFPTSSLVTCPLLCKTIQCMSLHAV